MNGERIHILCEEFDWSSMKGRIIALELHNNQLSEPVVAIELPYHVSYPFLIELQGRVYCVPETAQAREISLFEASEFPYKWRKISTLVSDFPGVDSTIFHYGDRWWLMSAVHEDSAIGLFVWHSDNLQGPWIPHSANPVKKDLSSSRPGGTPFSDGDYVYRPAQDCSRTYGGRIVLNRIISLTPTEYKEEQAIAIGPRSGDIYPHGLHTMSVAGNFTLVDGKRMIFAFRRAITERYKRVKSRSRFCVRTTK